MGGQGSARAGGEARRRREVQVRETRATDGQAAEQGGRFADADGVGKIGQGGMDHGRRIKQYVMHSSMADLAHSVG
ncbi:hypothetical protein B1218_36480, partial [Pseudomonas ogarae]